MLAGIHLHPRACPFAGVVEKITDHLLQILALAAEHQIVGASALDRQVAVGVNALQGPPQIADDGLDRRVCAQHVGAGRRSRTRQMMIDQPAHQRRLAAHRFAQHAGRVAGFVGQHRQRSLQGMGQIADMGPRPFDDGSIVRD